MAVRAPTVRRTREERAATVPLSYSRCKASREGAKNTENPSPLQAWLQGCGHRVPRASCFPRVSRFQRTSQRSDDAAVLNDGTAAARGLRRDRLRLRRRAVERRRDDRRVAGDAGGAGGVGEADLLHVEQLEPRHGGVQGALREARPRRLRRGRVAGLELGDGDAAVARGARRRRSGVRRRDRGAQGGRGGDGDAPRRADAPAPQVHVHPVHALRRAPSNIWRPSATSCPTCHEVRHVLVP